jgi:myo-inositol-1(or 4)-monophosphatase
MGLMVRFRESAENAVRQAGKIFMDTSLLRISEKTGVANFVTRIDCQVQEFLVDEIRKIIPGSNIITEESTENRFNLEKYTWILDPVDGTTNLIHAYNHSAVSLALFIERQPALAIIYNPFRDEMFSAESGKGAYLNHKKINVSGNGFLKDSLIGFGTNPYDRRKANRTFEITQQVFMKCHDIRRTGSAALDIAYVACGKNDGFFEMSLLPWDFAAGKIVLEEAGGKITNWDGNQPSVLSPDSIIATNGFIHEELLSFLA